MSCFGKRIDGPYGRRRSKRHVVMMAGSVVSLEGSAPVLVENVSHSGAKLVGRHLPPVGKQVLLWIDGLDVFGSIGWAAQDQRGLLFDAPLREGPLTQLN